MFRLEKLRSIVKALGKPDEETSDNRAGYTFFWGDRDNGPSLFIRRCAFQDDYEAICRPLEGSDSDVLMVEGDANTLLEWFEEHKIEIVARLKH